MSVRVGIVMDPIANISYKKDSSLAMLLAAQKRGWELFYMEQRDLYQGEGEARARMRPLKVFANPEKWFELGDESDALLSDLDVRHGIRLLHLPAGASRTRWRVSGQQAAKPA